MKNLYWIVCGFAQTETILFKLNIIECSKKFRVYSNNNDSLQHITFVLFEMEEKNQVRTVDGDFII